MKFSNHLVLVVVLLVSGFSWSQKKTETIGTEVINVVKSYSPTISDAFKVKEVPVAEVEKESDKEKVSYSIFSFPVASTFVPAKGKADGLEKLKEEKLFANYLTLGFGNYGTPLLDFYTAHKLDNDAYFGAALHHLSSQGGIKNTVLDDAYYQTKADFTYGVNKKTSGWNADLGYQHQAYNWYGVPNDVTIFDFSSKTLAGINPLQTYQTFYAGGRIYSKVKAFKEADLKYNHFWDGTGSAENRLQLAPSFEFKVENQKIKTDFVVDYVGGQFKQGYNDVNAINYGFTTLGFKPSIVFRKEQFSFNLGAGVFYLASSDTKNVPNKLFIYPQVSASFKLIPDALTLYAGADGGLVQNSYQQMVAQNPFLSPTLLIAPTEKAYDLHLGIMGKIASSMSFNLKGFHMLEKGKYLFMNNQFQDGSITTRQNFEYGNSFNVVYDNVTSTGVFGEVKLDFDKQVLVGLSATYSSYKIEKQQAAFNLPQLTTTLNLEYNITEKWQASSAIFYVGERKDWAITENTPAIEHDIVTVKGFVDANLQASYKYTPRLTGFVRANNIANQAYQKWVNYPVQQFQIMVGASYKFDF